MILDKLENADLYKGLSTRLDKGFEYLKSTNLKSVAPGSYDIAEGVRAIISEYNTKEIADAVIEAHEKFIDIQYLISGEEQIGYTALAGQTPTIPYNPERDVVFYNEEVSYTKLSEGMFAVYFPTDLHQPGVKISISASVKKCVIKVAV